MALNLLTFMVSIQARSKSSTVYGQLVYIILMSPRTDADALLISIFGTSIGLRVGANSLKAAKSVVKGT